MGSSVFPRDEVGRNRKLSRPWHGPYHVIEKKDLDITLCKVYFPDEKSIQFHQTRIQPCPVNFPAGYYWYGSRRVGPGRPPKWVERLMAKDEPTVTQDEDDACEVEQGESEKYNQTLTQLEPVRLVSPHPPARIQSQERLEQGWLYPQYDIGHDELEDKLSP